MKVKDLKKLLHRAGWIIYCGGKHDLATHPDKPGIKIPIPRHTEINNYTAKAILEQAGLK